jgi:hypothetical protein
MNHVRAFVRQWVANGAIAARLSRDSCVIVVADLDPLATADFSASLQNLPALGVYDCELRQSARGDRLRGPIRSPRARARRQRPTPCTKCAGDEGCRCEPVSRTVVLPAQVSDLLRSLLSRCSACHNCLHCRSAIEWVAGNRSLRLRARRGYESFSLVASNSAVALVRTAVYSASSRLVGWKHLGAVALNIHG